MDEIHDLGIEIKSSGNYILIQPLGLINYNSDLDWDKNWVKTRISVSGGAFKGAYDADLTTFDFENFKHDLNSLYDNLGGNIEFKDLEGYLSIKVNGDGTGNFSAEIICNDQPGINAAQLAYELNFDQTYIKGFVRKLNEITRYFPIIGD